MAFARAQCPEAGDGRPLQRRPAVGSVPLLPGALQGCNGPSRRQQGLLHRASRIDGLPRRGDPAIDVNRRVAPKGADRIELTFVFEGARYRPTIKRVPSEANLRRTCSAPGNQTPYRHRHVRIRGRISRVPLHGTVGRRRARRTYLQPDRESSDSWIRRRRTLRTLKARYRDPYNARHSSVSCNFMVGKNPL